MKSQFHTSNRLTLGDKCGGGLIILAGYSLLQRSNDSAHSFEQEANFWYLTGITEPDWWVIIDGTANKSWLVAPDVDEIHRIFEGGMSFEEAKKVSGVSTVIAQKEAEALLRALAKKHSVAYALGEDPHKEFFNFIENPAQKKLWTVLNRIFNSTQDCRLELAKLRAIKQPEEITALRKAIGLTIDAFEAVKEKLPQLVYEYQVEAEFDYYFKKHGNNHAYEPIVASGKNACTLHYEDNNSKLKQNNLLLLDVGARHNGYAADISRTYSVGNATKRQRAVHEAVERAHHDIISLLKPNLTVLEYHEKSDAILKQALADLDLIKDSDDESYRTYFPHAISHGLGIDTHDSLGRPEYFMPGMVLTVEPGIYIPKEGIGVRIEDDILITKNGNENLSRRLSTGL